MKHQQQLASPLVQHTTIQQSQPQTTTASNHNLSSNPNDATEMKSHQVATKTNQLNTSINGTTTTTNNNNNNNQDNLVTMKNNNSHEAAVSVTAIVNQKPKKGWLYRYTRNQWTPHWFVLNSGSLTYFRGPSAEITNFLDGVLDLSLIKEVQITSSSIDQASVAQQASGPLARRGPASSPANCTTSPRGPLTANSNSNSCNANNLAANATSVMVTSQQTHQHQHHHLQQNQHPHHNQYGNNQNEQQKFFSFSLKMWNGDTNMLAAESVEERQNWLSAIARERLDGYSDSSSGTESANQSGDDLCNSTTTTIGTATAAAAAAAATTTTTTTTFNNNNNDIQETLPSQKSSILASPITTQQFRARSSQKSFQQQQQQIVTSVAASNSGCQAASITTKLHQPHLTARPDSSEQQIVANYATSFHWNQLSSSQKSSFASSNVNNNNSLNKCFLYRNIRNSTEEVDDDEDDDDDGEEPDHDEETDQESDEPDEEAEGEGDEDEDDDDQIISETATANEAEPTPATLCAGTNSNQQIPMKKRVRFDLKTCAHVFQVMDTDASTSSSSSSSSSESEDEIEVDKTEENTINASCYAKHSTVTSTESGDATSIEKIEMAAAAAPASDNVVVNGVSGAKSSMQRDGDQPAEMTTDEMIITTESEGDDEEFVSISGHQHPINVIESQSHSPASEDRRKALATNLEKLANCLVGSVSSLVEHMDTSPSTPDTQEEPIVMMKSNNCQKLATLVSDKQRKQELSLELCPNNDKEPVTSGQLAAHLRREREITQASVSSLELRLAESQAGQLKLQEACERWQAEVTSMSERHRVRLEQLELRLHELSRELELKRLELTESRERLCHWEGLFYKLKSTRQLGLCSRHHYHRDHHHYQQQQMHNQCSDVAMCCRHNNTNAITQQTSLNSTSSSVGWRSHNKIAVSLAKLFVEPSHRISSASCQGILFRMATDQHKLQQHQQLSLKILNQNKQIQRKLNEIEHKVDNISSCQQVDNANINNSINNDNNNNNNH